MGPLSLIGRFGLTGRRKDLERTGTALLLAALLLGLTISGAVRRGMHHALPVSSGEEIALAVAPSDTVYDLNLGYVGFTGVLKAIQEAHWTKARRSRPAVSTCRI